MIVRTPLPRRVEIGESRVPPHPADCIQWIQDRRVLARRLGERGGPERSPRSTGDASATAARPAEDTARSRRRSTRRPRRRSRPTRSSRTTHALCAEQPPRMRRGTWSCELVLAVGLPRVRERKLSAVEHVLGPPAALERPVVGAGLDEADRAGRLLAQSSGQNTPGRPAAEHEHIEAGRAHSSAATTASTSALQTSSGIGGRMSSQIAAKLPISCGSRAGRTMNHQWRCSRLSPQRHTCTRPISPIERIARSIFVSRTPCSAARSSGRSAGPEKCSRGSRIRTRGSPVLTERVQARARSPRRIHRRPPDSGGNRHRPRRDAAPPAGPAAEALAELISPSKGNESHSSTGGIRRP